MLSDPMSITYNSVAKSLPRASGILPGVRREIGSSFYRDSAGEFLAKTSTSLLADNSVRSEILLGRLNPDPDSDPFNAGSTRLPNYVGLVFIANDSRWNTSTDVPLLRTALLSFVDSTLQGRLIAGEV